MGGEWCAFWVGEGRGSVCLCVPCVRMCVWYVCGVCVCVCTHVVCVYMYVRSYMIQTQRSPPPHTLLHLHTHLRLVEELNGNSQSSLLPSTETRTIGPAHLDVSFVVQEDLCGREGRGQGLKNQTNVQ